MSTLVYSSLTTRRYRAKAAGTPSDLGSYIEMVAALVPAEVLALHAAILLFTTETVQAAGGGTTQITDPVTLAWSFWGLLVLSWLFYIVPRGLNSVDKWDGLRMLIPPLAFVAWTMLQPSTAFDAAFPGFNDAPRFVIALFGAVILAWGANLLAKTSTRLAPGGEGSKPASERDRLAPG